MILNADHEVLRWWRLWFREVLNILLNRHCLRHGQTGPPFARLRSLTTALQKAQLHVDSHSRPWFGEKLTSRNVLEMS